MKQIDSIRLLQKIAIASNEATTVEEALQVCLDEICALTKWPVGHVYLHSDDATDEMVSTRIWHLDDPEKFASFKKVTEITSFEAGIGLPGRVYASGQPAWIPDVNKDPNFPRAQLAKITEVKAGFAFPVKVGSEVIAVLEFYSPKVISPKQDLLDVIVQAGEQISHVIKRSHTENEMQQHAEIINQIQDVVITTNMEGVIKSWNKCAEEQLGYTSEEMIGKPIDLVYLQLERKVMHSAILDALIEKGRIGLETTMRKKSGTVFPVYLSQSLSKDAKGTITGIIHCSSDITQQKRAEAMLERIKVIDQIHDAMIGTDLEGHITLWNRGAEILYGYTAEEILGETIYQLYPMENESTPPSEFIEIIKNKGGFEIESLMRKKSGEDIYVHNALSTLTDEKGNITGVISYAMDISGRKRAEEELRNYEQIVSGSSDLVAILNKNYIIEACNKQYLVYRNKKRDEIIGEHVMNVNETGYFDNVQKRLLDRCLAGETVRLQHWHNYEGVGKRYMDQQISPFSDTGGGTKALVTSRDITDLKHAEEELQQIHQRLTYHTEHSPLAVIEFDKDFKVKRWTKTAEKIFGWKAEEIIGKHLYEWKFVYEEDKGSVDDVLDDLSRGNELSYINLNRNYTKDGRIIDCEWYNSVLYDTDGNIDSVLSLGHDITERKQAERELQLANQRLTYHTEYSPIAVVEWDKNLCVRRWTKRAEEMFGWAAEDVIGKHPNDWQFVYSEDKEAVDDVLEGLTEAKKLTYINFNRNYTKDGRIIDCEWYNSVLVDDAGNVDSVFSLAHDITERKQAERELQLANQRLTYHTEYSPLAVVEFDKDFKVKRWTKTAEKIFGWKAEELIGKHLYEWKFVYDEDKADVDNVLNDLSQGKELSYINLNRNYTKDGRVVDCEWYNSILLDDAGNVESVLSLAHDITERKQAERELQLLNQRLTLHMENSPLGMLEMDRDFRVLRWSKQAEQIFGWNEDEIINKSLREIGLIYEEDANAVDNKLNDLAEGKIRNLVNLNRNYARDGRVLDCEWYNSAVIDENGELVSILALAHDITERKKAEEERLIFEQLISVSADFMAVINDKYEFDAVNQNYCEAMGKTREEIIGTHIREITGEKAFTEEFEPILNECFAGQSVRIQAWRDYPVIGRRYTDVLYTRYQDITSGEYKVTAVTRDITELRKAEEELHRFKRMVSASKDPMVLINKDYIVEACNPQYCEMRGVKPDDILGKHIDDINKENYFESNLKDILDRCLTGETVRMQHWRKYPTLEKDTYMDIQFVRYKDEDVDEPKILAMGRDITELKLAEEQLDKYRKHLETLVEERTEELKVTQEELVKKERLAVLGQLTAKVSHELRNPLGTIRSSLYTINNKVANQDFNLDVILNRADRNIKRCVNIIEQMLIYVPTSRYGIHGIVLTDIDKCITEILDEYEFAESIKVKRILDAGVSVKCEKENIRRSIINVITNACQAIEDNKTQSNKLLIKTFTIDNKLIIEITDTGIGIPEDKIVRIFEPLFSTKIYGVGLGLPIVKQVMEQYHGGIEVNSVENEGTQVKLWLPLNCEQAVVEHE